MRHYNSEVKVHWRLHTTLQHEAAELDSADLVEINAQLVHSLFLGHVGTKGRFYTPSFRMRMRRVTGACPSHYSNQQSSCEKSVNRQLGTSEQRWRPSLRWSLGAEMHSGSSRPPILTSATKEITLRRSLLRLK